MKLSRIMLATTASAALILAAVPTATAGQAPPVGPHRHFLLTPQGPVPVGPQICENSDLQAAFNQFHVSIHVGPANTAFDHTHNPVDITAGAC